MLEEMGAWRCGYPQALSESCDVYFYKVGQELGVDRLAWYARAFGLGERTGIDLDHEGGGLVPTAQWKKKRVGVSWQKGETLSVVIGQGFNLTTPLQMAMVAATVGNGGIRYRPKIVKTIRTAGGEVVFESTPEVVGRLPVSEKTLQLVREGLFKVVNDRHGRRGAVGWTGSSCAAKPALLRSWGGGTMTPMVTVKATRSRIMPGLWLMPQRRIPGLPWR
jgi:cell division protein FtsI/penicillin-binding protein 2